MRELTAALEMVLTITISLGIPVGILFLVGCLIHYREALQSLMSRLTGGAGEGAKIVSR